MSSNAELVEGRFGGCRWRRPHQDGLGTDLAVWDGDTIGVDTV